MLARAFNWPLTVDGNGEKLRGSNCLIEIKYVDASNLILYVANGIGIGSDELSEIVDSSGALVTRVTLNGTGVQHISIAGLTPGTHVGVKKVSGTGVANVSLLTGSEA